MNNIWSCYKRKLCNILKAVYNDEVNRLMNKHYKLLYSLVKRELDLDTFNDTFLKLTYNYNPELDFIELFKYYFNLLKGAYYRDLKVANYYLSFTDLPEIPYNPDVEILLLLKKISMLELKERVKQYADFKKSKKRANKTD